MGMACLTILTLVNHAIHLLEIVVNLSLDSLEKKVLNPYAKDPRTHFVLVCAAAVVIDKLDS